MVKIRLGKYHGILVVIVLAVALGMSTGVAQLPDPSHSWEEIDIPTGVWTGVTAEHVDWSGVIGRPSTAIIVVGMCEDAKDLIGQKFCGSDQKDYLNDPVGDITYCRLTSTNIYGHENKKCAITYPNQALEWNYTRGWGGVTKTVHIYYEAI